MLRAHATTSEIVSDRFPDLGGLRCQRDMQWEDMACPLACRPNPGLRGVCACGASTGHMCILDAALRRYPPSGARASKTTNLPPRR